VARPTIRDGFLEFPHGARDVQERGTEWNNGTDRFIKDTGKMN